MPRPKKDEYYLEIAKAVGKRSTCTRRKFGSIIVKNDTIVSTGYNGGARGSVNCNKEGCLKDEADAPSYGRYDLCPAVHSEENAVVNAARHGTQIKGGKLYILAVDPETGEETASKPCDRCSRILINAGIEEMITRNKEGDIIKQYPSNWADKEKVKYREKLKKAKKGQLEEE